MKNLYRKFVIIATLEVAFMSIVAQDAYSMIYPTGSSISVPSNNAYVCASAQVTFTGSNGTDQDECPSVTDNCVLHWYGDGTYPDGYLGTSVKWRAPGTAGTYTIKAAGDDTGEPDTHEYDWPYRSNYEISRTVNVLVPEVEEYNFSGNIKPGDAVEPVYKRARSPYTNEMTAAQKNGHFGLQDVKFRFSNSLTYSSNVQVDAGGTLAYDASSDTWSGQITSGMSLAGSGSNNLDNSVKVQTVSVSGFQYRVEYGSGVYSGWIGVGGGASHSAALLWNPGSVATRKGALAAAGWVNALPTDTDNLAAKLCAGIASNVTHDGSINLSAPYVDSVLTSFTAPATLGRGEPCQCEDSAGLMGELLAYHGLSGASIYYHYWGNGSERILHLNLAETKWLTAQWDGDGDKLWRFHAVCLYSSKYYDTTNGNPYTVGELEGRMSYGHPSYSYQGGSSLPGETFKTDYKAP